jgi:hypothetical protein
MLAPGWVDTEESVLSVPGLVTRVHAVPFQFRVRVCASVAPDGTYAPTAQTSFAALRSFVSMIACWQLRSSR